MGRAVLTSSDVGESSEESDRWGGGHGVFTWALINGLTGKADADGDHVVSADELFSYIRRVVALETGGRQNPKLFSDLGGSLQIAIVK
jgi:uncharacterized caspase-like protein